MQSQCGAASGGIKIQAADSAPLHPRAEALADAGGAAAVQIAAFVIGARS